MSFNSGSLLFIPDYPVRWAVVFAVDFSTIASELCWDIITRMNEKNLMFADPVFYHGENISKTSRRNSRRDLGVNRPSLASSHGLLLMTPIIELTESAFHAYSTRTAGEKYAQFYTLSKKTSHEIALIVWILFFYRDVLGLSQTCIFPIISNFPHLDIHALSANGKKHLTAIMH